MLEFLFEVFGEFILQVFGEALLELGLHALAEPFRRDPNVWLASIGYALFGALVGGLSLWVFPQHFTPAGILRMANLFLTPLAVGACMAGMGAWRKRRHEAVFLLNRFLYGFIFAAALAAVRFQFAH
jgi:hypothetical protein